MTKSFNIKDAVWIDYDGGKRLLCPDCVNHKQTDACRDGCKNTFYSINDNDKQECRGQCCCYGEHIGYIGEIEETGIFWNPMNVKVLSAVPTMSQVDTVWHYGMKKELKELALNYSKSKTLVQVKYTTERFVWRWEYYNRDIIVDIKPAT